MSSKAKQGNLHKRAFEEDVVIKPGVRVYAYKMLWGEMKHVYQGPSAYEPQASLMRNAPRSTTPLRGSPPYKAELGRQVQGHPHLQHVAKAEGQRKITK